MDGLYHPDIFGNQALPSVIIYHISTIFLQSYTKAAPNRGRGFEKMAVLQLIVVDDRDERMQHGRTDVAGVVVDAVNFQYLLHFGYKDTHFLPFSVIWVKQSVF